MGYTYSLLVSSKEAEGSIKNWVNQSNVPSALIVAEAEQYVYKHLRVRQMLTSVSGTLTIGDTSIALTSIPRYRMPLTFWITGTDVEKVKHRLPEEVEGSFQYDADGNRVQAKPVMYYVDATNLNFDSPADKAYTWKFTYYQGLTPLDGGASNDTNFLTDTYPDLLRSACLMRAYEWMKDMDDKLYWKQITDEAIMAANQEYDIERGRNLELEIIAG